ncbi:loricrin-like [Watersipora subatra]|uniref:loricrin-like n=1 Tax=Watersipora subatra TaxID=2589382 RepID=UPI00355BFAFB
MGCCCSSPSAELESGYWEKRSGYGEGCIRTSIGCTPLYNYDHHNQPSTLPGGDGFREPKDGIASYSSHNSTFKPCSREIGSSANHSYRGGHNVGGCASYSGSHNVGGCSSYGGGRDSSNCGADSGGGSCGGGSSGGGSCGGSGSGGGSHGGFSGGSSSFCGGGGDTGGGGD